MCVRGACTLVRLCDVCGNTSACLRPVLFSDRLRLLGETDQSRLSHRRALRVPERAAHEAGPAAETDLRHPRLGVGARIPLVQHAQGQSQGACVCVCVCVCV